MDFSKFEKQNPQNSKEDMNVNFIETENQFWLWIEDAKNQFGGIRLKAQSIESSKELLSFVQKYEYFNCEELLRKQNRSLSEKIQKNERVQMVMKTYDDLVSRIKVLKTRRQLKQIFEELDEFIQRFNLGLDE